MGRCGVSTGAAHGWFGEEGDRKAGWWPPLCLLADVARRTARGAAEGSRVVWVGKRVWVYPWARGAREILERSIFVDPPALGERVWAVDVALRCRGVAVVVADGSGLKMAESRRWQLAAAAGGAMGLIARPGWELCELSAAKTRWRVMPERSQTSGARWSVELLRCKEVNPVPHGQRRWSVMYEAGNVGVVAAAGNGPAAAAGAEGGRTRDALA